MFTDLFNTNMEYNIKLAKVLGIKESIYITSLFKFLNKDNRNSEKDFFPLNRLYINNISGLSKEEQIEIEKLLSNLDIIEFNSTKDKIKINSELILKIILEEDTCNIDDLKNKINLIKQSPTQLKKTKRQIIADNLKLCIECSNEELLNAYKGWVDGVYANPNGFLSKESIKYFQDSVNKYTQGDLDLALEIIKIATVNGYRDFQWSLNEYEKRNPKKPKIKSKTQNINNSLDNKEVF